MRSRLAAIATAISVFIFLSYILLPSSPVTPTEPPSNVRVPDSVLHGEAIMPHLGNETIKAELGNAAWKLLHTTLARYPKKPTPDEREALSSYLHLFARLYPCGECAAHFRLLLQKYPPQTGSRDAASQWGCFLHNQVNERLKKAIFDCGKVTEHYKCGCADADEEKAGEKKGADKLETNILKAEKGSRVDIERGPLNMNGG